MILLTTLEPSIANKIILVFECISLAASLLMILVGILQNKEFQTGLAALNGGNDELFANSKERGKQKILSRVMLILGIILVISVIISSILGNTIVIT